MSHPHRFSSVRNVQGIAETSKLSEAK
jgi:hypothetical protein